MKPVVRLTPSKGILGMRGVEGTLSLSLLPLAARGEVASTKSCVLGETGREEEGVCGDLRRSR